MNGIWAMGQAMFTKCIIVVDEDCDVQDLAEVTLRATNNIDPERDIQFTLGPVDSLDHASRLPNFGSRWASMPPVNGLPKVSPALATGTRHGLRNQILRRRHLEEAGNRGMRMLSTILVLATLCLSAIAQSGSNQTDEQYNFGLGPTGRGSAPSGDIRR